MKDEVMMKKRVGKRGRILKRVEDGEEMKKDKKTNIKGI